MQPKMERLLLRSSFPIALSDYAVKSLKVLQLYGHLHPSFDIQFPNLSTFDFEGPILGPQLTQAVRRLANLTDLRQVTICQSVGYDYPSAPSQLARELTRLLSSSESIEDFRIRLVITDDGKARNNMVGQYKTVVDLSRPKSLQFLFWDVKNFSTHFIMPFCSKIKIEWRGPRFRLRALCSQITYLEKRFVIIPDWSTFTEATQ